MNKYTFGFAKYNNSGVVGHFVEDFYAKTFADAKLDLICSKYGFAIDDPLCDVKVNDGKWIRVRKCAEETA